MATKYSLKVFKKGTDISTQPHEIIRYLTFISNAPTMDALGIEIRHTLRINGYEGYSYLCSLQLRTRNV